MKKQILFGKPPVYIFQMGKVGSRSLKNTLTDKYSGPVFHAHNHSMMSEKEQNILKWRKRTHLPLLVISPIREPISRNISSFFQNLEQVTGYKFRDKNWTISELRSLFLGKFNHTAVTEWFDRTLRTTFDIDVYSVPFPCNRKWNIYKNGAIRLLVYRTDMNRDNQLQLISEFLGENIDEWIYGNMSEDRPYAEFYRQFYETVNLPKFYISIMYQSRFTQHFWSKSEIAALTEKYLGKP